jgi:hypothetical protein
MTSVLYVVPKCHYSEVFNSQGTLNEGVVKITSWPRSPGETSREWLLAPEHLESLTHYEDKTISEAVSAARTAFPMSEYTYVVIL